MTNQEVLDAIGMAGDTFSSTSTDSILNNRIYAGMTGVTVIQVLSSDNVSAVMAACCAATGGCGDSGVVMGVNAVKAFSMTGFTVLAWYT